MTTTRRALVLPPNTNAGQVIEVKTFDHLHGFSFYFSLSPVTGTPWFYPEELRFLNEDDTDDYED